MNAQVDFIKIIYIYIYIYDMIEKYLDMRMI